MVAWPGGPRRTASALSARFRLRDRPARRRNGQRYTRRYLLNEPDLRRTIHAATNKREQFNHFAQWLIFGGEGVIAENVRHEQRKVIKYNHLVANRVVLYNVQWMSRRLKELQEKGHPVDATVLKVLSPYQREHINRFGDSLLDLLRSVPPLDPTIEFVFKSAA
jgi:hypothetical protein